MGISASSSYRQLKCIGSDKLVQSLAIHPRDTPLALLGRKKHDEISYNIHRYFHEKSGFNECPYTKQLVKLLDNRQLIKKGYSWSSEIKLSPTGFTARNAVIDFLATDNESLLIVDFKTGYVSVEVHENVQLLMYMLYYLKANSIKNIKRVFVSIIQPSQYDCAQVWEVKNFEERIESLIKKINQHDDEVKKPICPEDFIEGTHCKYCPAMAYCPKKLSKIKNYQTKEVIKNDKSKKNN